MDQWWCWTRGVELELEVSNRLCQWLESFGEWTMTTAARPTFEPARGGRGKGEGDLSALSKQYSSRDLPSHTKLKYRWGTYLADDPRTTTVVLYQQNTLCSACFHSQIMTHDVCWHSCWVAIVSGRDPPSHKERIWWQLSDFLVVRVSNVDFEQTLHARMT